jgi:hypothetical protein
VKFVKIASTEKAQSARVSVGLVGFVVLASLASCGGGGGGSSAPDSSAPVVPPPQAEVIAADAGVYFPSAGPTKYFRGIDPRESSLQPAGNYPNIETWSGSGTARTLHETDPLHASIDGTAAGDDDQISVASDGVHELSGKWIAKDAVILRSPVLRGDQYKAVEQTIPLDDLDGDGRGDSAAVVVTVQVVGNESAQVAAGLFATALKVVTTATVTVTGTKAGLQAPVAVVSTDWYVSGIGRIRTVYVDGSSPAPNNVVTEELAGYRDGAQAFGYMAGTPLFSDRTLDYLKAPPAVETDGVGYLVALSQGAGVANNSLEGGGPVVGTLVGADGMPGSTKTLILTASHGGYSPAVVSTGTGYLVVSGNYNGFLAQRVSSAGALLDGPLGVSIYSTGSVRVSTPALARLGDRILMAWAEETGNADGTRQIRAMLLDAATGQPVSSPVSIAAPGADVGYPRVVAGADGFLVAFSGWADRYNGTLARAYAATIYASRIGTNGQVIDPQPVALSTAGTAHGVAEARFNGTDYVVSWPDNRNHLQDAHGGVYPPEDADMGTFSQDIFATLVSPSTGSVKAGLPATGISTTSVTAYRDSSALAMTTSQIVDVHNVFAAGTASGVYLRRLDASWSATGPASSPDNLYALDALPTFSQRPFLYGLTQVAGNASSALAVFVGSQCGATLCSTLILPPTTR